ncbi:uncharacterized protein LOC124416603 isoform X2 [Diprion similis]|uniref:uncharacterized protein LOC124416603 isoform X2 n=1 Tax=Diprion similis TaxID=362088 RepID=UPI001EF8763D|nr:uncharacterized protein LOC124416603 isoform X2 [Diprion similis]
MSGTPRPGPLGTRGHPGPVTRHQEIAMNPRALAVSGNATALPPPTTTTTTTTTTLLPPSSTLPRLSPAGILHPQVDVSTQADLHGVGGLHGDWGERRATPLYSREDIKEQYCITNRQLDAVERSGGGIFGCLSSRGPSPCASARTSLLSACVRGAPSEENLFDAPYPRTFYHQPHPGQARGQQGRYDTDEEDYPDNSYFRRRPTSFCTTPDPKRYTWVPEDEESTRLEGPRPVLPPTLTAPTSINHRPAPQQPPRPKHVSFARSHTLTSFEVPRSRSPPRSHERLIDSQPTMQGSLSAVLPLTHTYANSGDPRVLVLEKPPKRGVMKTQATQTEVPQGLRGRVAPITLSPRTIHRVKMVSQGAQTNGILNGRKLTKSYSEAGQLGTPLGATSPGGTPINGNTDIEHEPLQRTQSEEPPRSPFLVNTPPTSLTPIPQPSVDDRVNGESDNAINQADQRLVDSDNEEILIDFKPAPISPRTRSSLSQTPRPCRRIVPLQKTLSDGEIQVERRELIGETSEPSYPHSCRRNHHDPWSKSTRTPILFSSTPDDLALLRATPPGEEHYDEEFHENLIKRGLFRKRSVSLEDGVQNLGTGPTVTGPQRAVQSPGSVSSNRHHLHAKLPVGIMGSPFASSDSLANDVTRDHSDGIWNESQATVLQADSLALLTPSSRRRHLLILQHQQRSSMDTEALDAEDEMEVGPPSPRIRLEPATPVSPVPSIDNFPSSARNGRQRSGLRRRSPIPPPLSQPQSQSSSEFGLSLVRTDSGRTNTDVSETSTTEDYVTANTSTGTGTTTGNSGTTSSRSRHPQLHSGAVPSAPASATATAADGSSFESASSIYSLARSEAVVEEPCSPPAIIEESEASPGIEPPPSPARSTSSSSSGSYDLEDAMPEPLQDSYPTAPLSGAASETEPDHDEERRSSSGGYAESPPDTHLWSEEERRRRRKTFTLDFQPGAEVENGRVDGYIENRDVSPTPSHRHRLRGKPLNTRSPHRNNKKRDSAQQQQIIRSPQKDDWREPLEDGTHVPTSDDSSCSHRYHLHHHHHHHHRESIEGGRHRRVRESPRRKTGGYISSRRKSNEDKNAALTGSLPRRRSRPVEEISSSRLSPGGHYQRSPGHNGHATIIVKSPSPEARLKALSAESLRSVSPGSDSVFYSEGADHSSCVTASLEPLDAPHCHHCGREVQEEIVQPPAGFADSPEGHKATTKHSGHRLYKKFDKRFRSEDRSERRHLWSNGSRSEVRAKSEERNARSSSPREECSRRRLQARSTDASMEVLTGRENDARQLEAYATGDWICIEDFRGSHVWRKPESRGDEDDVGTDGVPGRERRDSQGSTESEKCFARKYHGARRRMIHAKISGEMQKRIHMKSLKSDKRVIVKREPGGEFGFRIHGSKPVVVSVIEPDMPAESSGLEVGDIIISVNGRSVMDAVHSEVVRLAHSGTDILELEVVRTCNILAPQVPRSGSKDGPAEAPLCSGYLWRRATTSTSSTSDKWVRRWFALRRDNCLYCYKTDADSQPVGAVMLLKYAVTPTPDVRPHSFVITKPGAPTLHLGADTEEAASRWATVIKEAVEKNNQGDTWLNASLRLQQMPPCTIQRPDCFGYLSKQQGAHTREFGSSWSRRYCVLKDAVLYFYDDANAERAFGIACVRGFSVHWGASGSAEGRKHAFELQPPDSSQKSHIFATESEMDKKRWIAALEYSIDRWIKIG